MSWLEKLAEVTGYIDLANGLKDAVDDIKNAQGALETSAAVSGFAAEVAVGIAVTATVRTS